MSKTNKRKRAKKNENYKNDSQKNMLFKWRLKKLIFDFPESAQTELTKKRLIQSIIPALQNHEGVKLLEITTAHPNHHPVNFAESPNPAARKWLAQHDEYNGMEYQMFSFSIENKKRLYGYIDGSVFYPIWYDHYHQLYPSAKKRT